jgi:valyl-tRNA synthetase
LKPAGFVSPHDVAVLKILLNAEPFEADANYVPPKGTLAAHSLLGDLYLPLEGLVDLGAEKTRLNKELEKIKAEIATVEQKLTNPAFTGKVPPAVLQEHQKRLVDWQEKKARVETAMKALEG